jgi:hypothetical protein
MSCSSNVALARHRAKGGKKGGKAAANAPPQVRAKA